MKDYEGIFITKVLSGDDAAQKLLDQIQGEISKNGGKVEGLEKWGRRTIAYPIKKNKEGVYYKLDFKLEPGKVSELNKTYRLIEDILRAMIVAK